MYYVILTEVLTGLCNTNDKEITYTLVNGSIVARRGEAY